MVKVNPAAELEPRKGDENVSLEQLREMSLFKTRRERSIDKDPVGGFPGALMLRKYRTGETIVVEGEPGWTLFYVLTSADLRELRESQQDDEKPNRELQSDIDQLRSRESRIQELREAIANQDASDHERSENESELWSLLDVASVSLRTTGDKKKGSPRSDTPTDTIREGEVFGEMSCLYRTPRSATVKALRECYVLEMLRNVYDRLGHTEQFKKQIADTVWDRLIHLHMPNHPLFRSIDAREYERLKPEIRANGEMISKAAGEIICDQHERSDAIYIIRSGYVKVTTNTSVLLSVPQIKAWRPLCSALARAMDEDQESELLQLLKTSLESLAGNESLRQFAQTDEENATLSDAAKSDVVDRLNDSLCSDAGFWFALRKCVAQGAPPKKKKGDEAEPDPEPNPVLKSIWEQATIHLGDNRALQGAASPKSKDAVDLPNALAMIEAVNREISLRGQESVRESCGLRGAIAIDANVCEQLSSPQIMRYFNRAVLCALLPEELPAIAFAGPPRTLGYRQTGDFIGEIGVIGKGVDDDGFQMTPRTATCVAYDHPILGQTPGNVELVRLNAKLVHRLWQMSPKIQEELQQIIAERLRVSEASQSPMPTTTHAAVSAEVVDELGLVQGNRLMLIDYDRCTRCNVCVEACVDTHKQLDQTDKQDVYSYNISRLYLDGPRAGRYLVPATCRQCTDPVCLIGCPVGSIHKGAFGEVQIEDWCVGCTVCAQNCPYDAIQMHQLGLVHRGTGQWRFGPAVSLDDLRGGVGIANWPIGATPFHYDIEFRQSIRGLPKDADGRVGFVAEFSFSKHDLQDHEFLLQIESEQDPKTQQASAWLNGEPLELRFKRTRDRDVVWHYTASIGNSLSAARLHPSRESDDEGAAQSPPQLKPGVNVFAVALRPPAEPASVMLDLGVYPVRASDETEQFLQGVEWDEKIKMTRAVVCDMCASTPSTTPACVASCPHDAAWRGVLADSPLQVIR